MADCSLPSSLPLQPQPDLSPDEVETLARVVKNRNHGFLPSAHECDTLIEIVLRYVRGER